MSLSVSRRSERQRPRSWTGGQEPGELDLLEPLGGGHVPVQAGHHEPGGEAVADRERTRVGQWRPCVWQQYRDASHVAPYCNVLSHLQALDDLLRFGTWCDHVELARWPDDTDEAEMVFRFYGVVFLLWEELVADLRIIGGAATTGKSTKRKLSTTEPLMEFINRTWKHRSTPLRAGRPFHASHHHGPYVFADVPGYRDVLPADGAYAALDHHPSPGTTGPLVLVVPSITLAMTDLGRAMVETSSLLRDVSARQKVIDVYGARHF